MSAHIEIKITSPLNEERKDILVAVFSSMGFTGFEEEKNVVKAFILAQDFDEHAFNEYCEENEIDFEKNILEEKNWNEEWEKNFAPVIVENYCAIRADFHGPVQNVKHEIIITPKMSFGTGHHATTYMMIKAMRQLDFTNKEVFDFGTGTGVLAILAEKEGAVNVLAIDNDEWSIENAKENIERNSCSRITIGKADSIDTNKKFDIILANINRNVILQHLRDMKLHLAEGGILMLSGLLNSDKNIILEEATRCDLKSTDMIEQNSWICLKMQ